MRGHRSLLVLGLTFFTIGCDQGTKVLATHALKDGAPIALLNGTFRLLYAQNTGGFGSLGAHWPEWARWLGLVAIPLVFLGAMLVHAFRAPGLGKAHLVGAALVVGGGLGNLVDRVLHGYVVDFMYAGIGRIGTNVFNVADVALMIGIPLLFLARRRADEPPAAPVGPPEPPAP